MRAEREALSGRSVALLFAGLALALVIALLGVAFLTRGDDSEAPGEIANAPTASADPSVSETPRAPSPPVDTTAVSKRLNQCVNGATDYKHIKDHAYDCFMGYTVHLPNIYAIRDIGPVTVSDMQVSDDTTAKVTAKLSVNGHDAGTLEAYWSEGSSQFKVVDSELNDWSEVQVRNDVIKQVENQL